MSVAPHEARAVNDSEHFCCDEQAADSIPAGLMGQEGPLGGPAGTRLGYRAALWTPRWPARHLPRSSRVSGTLKSEWTPTYLAKATPPTAAVGQ